MEPDGDTDMHALHKTGPGMGEAGHMTPTIKPYQEVPKPDETSGEDWKKQSCLC